jgi:hypothetical protein
MRKGATTSSTPWTSAARLGPSSTIARTTPITSRPPPR